MRIRLPFALAFLLTLLLCAFLGFSPSSSSSSPDSPPSTPPSTHHIPTLPHSDKLLHFTAFFLTTLSFYWILDTTRRRVLQLSFATCTLGLGVGSEVVQGWMPINRPFDPYDILANVLGSLLALTACNWYHRRMLERKRKARGYTAVAGGGGDGDDDDGDSLERTGDVELGVVGGEEERWEEGDDGEWDSMEPELEPEPEQSNGKGNGNGNVAD